MDTMLPPEPGELGARLGEAASATGLVGASVAVAGGGDVVTAVFGATSRSRPDPIDASTRFRIGSIAKVYTSTLLVELMLDRGIQLEERVTNLIPGFRLADGAEEHLTVMHLLTHSGGIEGDLWDGGFGDGPSAIAEYVGACRSLATVFPPGASWGYSNSGFVIAGRIVEVLAGRPYPDVMGDYLSRLQLGYTELRPGMVPAGYANGHYVESDGLREAGAPEEDAAFLPAGSWWLSTASDVLAFAALHAIAPSTSMLGSGVVEAMRVPRVELPPFGGTEPTHHGLGWKIYDWPSGRVLGHNGNGTGQAAFLRFDPERSVGVALLANTIPAAAQAWAELCEWLLPALGIQPPRPPQAVGRVAGSDLLAHVGTYAMRGIVFRVRATSHGLELEMDVEWESPRSFELRQVTTDHFVTPAGVGVVFRQLQHYDLRLLHLGPFTARRVTD